MNRNTNSFATNQIGFVRLIGPRWNPNGPPRNRVTMMADMVTVFMNSASWNTAKRIDEYSVWNPPTSSCSASTRSNGGRFSSAVAPTTKMKKGTNPRRTMFQFHGAEPWSATMSQVESEPVTRTTAATDRPRAAS